MAVETIRDRSRKLPYLPIYSQIAAVDAVRKPPPRPGSRAVTCENPHPHTGEPVASMDSTACERRAVE
jgi:hypothetical protein